MNDDPTLESLRVDPGSFAAMVDRSAGGPEYRRVIIILKGVIAVVAVAVVCAVVIIAGSLNRFGQVLGRLDTNRVEAEEQRELLVEQTKILIECLTLSPKPGMELDESDRVHECQAETEGLRGAAVAQVILVNIRIHECLAEKAPDLRACITTPP